MGTVVIDVGDFCMATDSMAGYLLVLLSVIVPLLAALPDAGLRKG